MQVQQTQVVVEVVEEILDHLEYLLQVVDPVEYWLKFQQVEV